MSKKHETQLLAGVFILAAILGIAAIALVIFRLEKSEVFILALIPISGLTLAAIIAAVALLFRARHPPTPPVEKHVIHTKERVLDGRYPGRSQIVTLPSPGNTLSAGLYPHLLRGAYQSGQHNRTDPSIGHDKVTTEWEGQIIEVEPE